MASEHHDQQAVSDVVCEGERGLFASPGGTRSVPTMLARPARPPRARRCVCARALGVCPTEHSEEILCSVATGLWHCVSCQA